MSRNVAVFVTTKRTVGGVGSHAKAKILSILNGGSAIEKFRSRANENENSFYAKAAVQASRVNVSGMPKRLPTTTTSGLNISADPKRTTTILGSYSKDMGRIIKELKYPSTYDFGAKRGGFNVLNTPNWALRTRPEFWEKYNKPFLESAIKRGDRIVLATKPTRSVISIRDSSGRVRDTGFGKEIRFLKEHGYAFDSSTNAMIRR